MQTYFLFKTIENIENMVLIKRAEYYDGKTVAEKMAPRGDVERYKPEFKYENENRFLVFKTTSFVEYTLDLKKEGILSMLYVVSKLKPRKVLLTSNDLMIGKCKGDNIRKMDIPTSFEEFTGNIELEEIEKIPIDEDGDFPHKKYKIVMFGKDGNINFRNGFKSEAYFFPLDRLIHTTERVTVFFDVEESASLPNHDVYLFSEFLFPTKTIDMLSLYGSYKSVYLLADGAVGKRFYYKKEVEELAEEYINNPCPIMEKGVV